MACPNLFQRRPEETLVAVTISDGVLVSRRRSTVGVLI